jgi:hypothetical protein
MCRMNINDHRERIAELEADFTGGGTSVLFFEPPAGGIWVEVKIETSRQLQYEVGGDPDAWDGELESAIEQLHNERDS